MQKIDVDRIKLANEVAEELGIKEVDPILRNISVPADRLKVCTDLGARVQKSLMEDTLKHVGVAFYRNGIMKYVDRNGETQITKSCDAVIEALTKAGYEVIDANFIFGQEKVEECVSKSRTAEDEIVPLTCGYGLSKELREKIDAFEKGKSLSREGSVPFSGRNFDLGSETSEQDAVRLAAFKYYPLSSSIETIHHAKTLEAVEGALRGNAELIGENFDNYKNELYARSHEDSSEM